MSSEKYNDETIEGIENFHKRIKEIENEKYKKIIIIFSGSTDTSGKSWCPDCIRLEGLLGKFKSKIRIGSILIHVKIGSKDDWKKPDNPFRNDQKLKITGVPTVLIWNTAKRLQAPEIFDQNVLDLILEDD